MTDFAKALEDKTICPECGGDGVTMVSYSYHECCMSPNKHGECCGNPVEAVDYHPDHCPTCRATGFVSGQHEAVCKALEERCSGV